MNALLRQIRPVDALHLAVLCSLAVAQPLFDLLGDNAEFFVAHDSSGLEITLLALGLTLAPPAVLVLAEALASLGGERIRELAHLAFVALLSALISLQALVGPAGDLPGGVLMTASLGTGLAAAWVYQGWQAIRTFLTFLGPAPVAFVALFLLTPPVSKLTIGGTAEAETVASSASTPVVMVVFDEFPTSSLLDEKGQIDADLYPNFAELVRDATWFPNATTVADHTTWAVPAILTGNRPERDLLPIASDHPRSLFTLLGGTHRMVVNEDITRVCPEDLCEDPGAESFGSRFGTLVSDVGAVYPHLVLPEGMRGGLAPIDTTWRDFGREGDRPHGTGDDANGPPDDAFAAAITNRTGKFARFTSSITQSRRPSLYFTHVMLPHSPWQYLPSGKAYGRNLDVVSVLGQEDELWGSDPTPVTHAYQRHLLQVGFLDRQIGRLLERLRETELYDETLIVLVADHGVSFRPGDKRRGATATNVESQAAVPLIVKAPRQRRGRVDRRFVRTMDILPTVVDILDIHPPWEMDGRSALDAGGDERRSLEIFRGDEPTVRVGAASFVRRLKNVVERKVAMFGSGAWDDVLGAGARSASLGRRVDTIPSALSTGLRAEVDAADLLRSVDLESATVPSLVVGHAIGPGAVGVDLAIALNGRVAATTRTFDQAGQAAFQALLPESSFREGANELEVFAFRDGGRIEGLTGRGGATAAYRLAADVTRLVIHPPNGRPVDVVPDAMEGYVESVSPNRDGSVTARGWAVSRKRRRPAGRIVLFTGNRFLYSLVPNLSRPDVAEALDLPGVERSGFAVDIPRQALSGDTDGSSLRVFAIHGRVGSELERILERE